MFLKERRRCLSKSVAIASFQNKDVLTDLEIGSWDPSEHHWTPSLDPVLYVMTPLFFRFLSAICREYWYLCVGSSSFLSPWKVTEMVIGFGFCLWCRLDQCAVTIRSLGQACDFGASKARDFRANGEKSPVAKGWSHCTLNIPWVFGELWKCRVHRVSGRSQQGFKSTVLAIWQSRPFVGRLRSSTNFGTVLADSFYRNQLLLDRPHPFCPCCCPSPCVWVCLKD